MKEIWKPVKGFEEYAEISNLGQIHKFRRVIYSGRGHNSKRIQEETWTYGSESGDYLQAYIGGVVKGVHVWVYLTFVGDIPKGLEVNHIDENKHNNRLDNLNLMTPKENSNWGTRNSRVAAALRGRKLSPEHIARSADARRGKKRSEETRKKMSDALKGKYNTKISKAVQALDKDGNVVMEFPSTMEAERQGYGNHSLISACCNAKLKTYKGFIWRYKFV